MKKIILYPNFLSILLFYVNTYSLYFCPLRLLKKSKILLHFNLYLSTDKIYE